MVGFIIDHLSASMRVILRIRPVPPSPRSPSLCALASSLPPFAIRSFPRAPQREVTIECQRGTWFRPRTRSGAAGADGR